MSEPNISDSLKQVALQIINGDLLNIPTLHIQDQRMVLSWALWKVNAAREDDGKRNHQEIEQLEKLVRLASESVEFLQAEMEDVTKRVDRLERVPKIAEWLAKDDNYNSRKTK